MLLVLPLPPAPPDWMKPLAPKWAVTVTASPGKTVLVLLPPCPMVYG